MIQYLQDLPKSIGISFNMESSTHQELSIVEMPSFCL
jgi:hypothetical protein